jgi:hypothetical protein
MIFRWLWRRRVGRTFGRFLAPESIDELTAPQSESDCFKLLLPARPGVIFSTGND